MPRPVIQCAAVLLLNALFKDFAAADTDGDGSLSIEEIDVYIRTNRR